MSAELENLWSQVRSELRKAVTDSTFQLWLEPLEPRELVDRTLVLTAPDEIRGWVSDRFGRVLQSCAAAALGPETTVDVVGVTEPRRSAASVPAAHVGAGGFAPGPGELNPKYTFDQFVIGDGNRLAHAAALAVAELPGQAYNPLFIYGPPGLGKTHLLHSIGNYVRAYGTGTNVRYTTIEAFTNDFITALQSGAIGRFKDRYRHNDVLLIDDVQFLESKAKTEEEFFHTFNALYETGSQLVLTSDRLPRDMAALEERLRERFEAGLVTDVRPPDAQTRLTILRKRVRHDGIVLEHAGALELIAERITENIRALEGALIRVVAFHSLTGRQITVELVREVLDGLYPGSSSPRAARRTVREIQEATAEAFGLSLEDLLSESRTARVSWPRQIAMYLARELTEQTLPAIGRQFGGRNHTTVLHAWKRTAERIAADRDAFETVRRLTERLQAQ